MTRNILTFVFLIFVALPAGAATLSDEIPPITNQYCISSQKLLEIRNQFTSQDPKMQRAYDMLFNTLLHSNPVGCITQADLATICTFVWIGDLKECEKFTNSVISKASQPNFTTLEVSTMLAQNDFSTIDPDAFHQAFNKAVARRAKKSIPSKLQDMGRVFLDEAKDKQINPFVSAAISLYESGRGTAPLARTKNNIAGLGGPGRWMTFNSVPDSIRTQANTLHNKITAGKKDLRTLACSGSYCENNRMEWFNDISSVVRELYRNYNEIIQGKK